MGSLGGGGSLSGPASSSAPGPAGRGISSTATNSAGHLILTYTDGTTSDAGLVVGTAGATGRGIASAAVNSSNHLILTFTDTTSADLGLVVGGAGAAGRGISSSTINGSGHLVLSYSDGTTADLGNVMGAAGQGATLPVTTSTTPGSTYALAFPSAGSAAYDLTPNQALTLSLSGGSTGQLQRLTLILRGNGYAVTLPAESSTIKYAGGSAPAVSTTSGQITVITFATSDGGATYLGGI